MHAKNIATYIILKLKEIKNKEKSQKKPELKQQQQKPPYTERNKNKNYMWLSSKTMQAKWVEVHLVLREKIIY